MVSVLNVRSLTLILGALLALRFLIVPIISWQNQAISYLNFEGERLQKMRALVVKEKELSEAANIYDAQFDMLRGSLYEDSESLKLSAQAELMEAIALQGLSVKSFSWVADISGSHRTLRIKIAYIGSLESSIRLIWALAASERLYRVVDSRYVIKSRGKDSLGGVEGFVTLEFYAVGESDGEKVG